MPINVLTTAVKQIHKALRDTQSRSYRLDEQSLIDKACRRAHCESFDDERIREPLRILLSACRREANLNLVGELAFHSDTTRLLSNLLKIRADMRRWTDIAEQPIRQPIFIMGLPRSGTTFLHRLLTADPANHTPRCWQMLYPSPPAENFSQPSGLRLKRTDIALGVLRTLAPEYSNVNPINARFPQQCTEIFAHIFVSARFDILYRIPSYGRWLESIGVGDDAYRFHKHFLQYLQYRTGPGQWVLKAPEHIFSIAAIQHVYPDAKMVFSHRDPLKVIPSDARLTEVMRRPFSRKVYPREIGAQLAERWMRGAETMMQVAQSRSALSSPVFHMKYQDLVREPTETVKRLYDYFDMPFPQETENRIKRFVARHRDGDYGSNQYTLDRYGIDGQALRRRCADYMAYFGVQPEVDIG
jgi:hypothetical protein